MPKRADKPKVTKASAFMPSDQYQQAIKRADREGFSTSGFISQCVRYVLGLKETPFKPVPKGE